MTASDLILFWHRRDLRLEDNLGLAAARQRSPRIVGVFCLDPALLTVGEVAPARVAYLLGSLNALHQDYRGAGSDLLFLQGPPLTCLVRLAIALQAQAVYWNEDGEPYSRERDRQVTQALREVGIATVTHWDQLLHPPGTIVTKHREYYKVYTPFWRNWSQQPKADPVSLPKPLQGLGETAGAMVQGAGGIPLPSLQTLGMGWEGTLPLAPGSQAALAQLKWFGDRALLSYQEQRNFPELEEGTSRLSAALKFGTVGIRQVWATTQEALDQSRSDEARESIRTWQQELAWREFYQHALYGFPELAEGPYRPMFRSFPWENRDDYFQAWCEGKTGYPIVDAAMRQLQATGWMHNRCRMIVASFLTKDLIIHWQWGERFFMQTLVDGDLAANNGGWQWSASSGMDPKPLRIFNPASQAQKFDPEGTYIRRWLPEIAGMETADLLRGVIDPGEGDRRGYPQPIVDHRQRQQRFKVLYQQAVAQPG